MIGRLTGRIADCRPGTVLVDVGGVGYALQIPLSTYYQLAGHATGTVSLHVHTHVREDTLALFGFATTSERATFERLLRITGVGPRLALGVLSGIGAEELERAVLDGDRDRLQRIPGIGRKTAERILLELRDRLEREDREARRPRGGAPRAAAEGPERTRLDAVSALQNLGYARQDAHEAVDRALAEAGDEPRTLEWVLKTALRNLVQG